MTIIYSVSSTPTTFGAAPAVGVDGYFSTKGNQIVDNHGNDVRIAGVNWYGMEGPTGAPGGLWTRNYQDMMDQMVQSGFNTIRLCISGDTLTATSPVTGVDFTLNPDLVGLTPPQVLDEIVEYAGKIGMRIILDYHRYDAGAGSQESGLWYDSTHPESQWISQLSSLAAHYANNPTVVGIDLFNEPHGLAHWGGVGGVAGDANDWAAAATQAGNAVLAANPKMLVFVEGVENYTNWYICGGNLEGVANNPINLNVANKLVYEAHDYPYSVIPGAQNVSWLQNPSVAIYDSLWTQHWGYIYQQNIAPVLLGEFGNPGLVTQDQVWAQGITPYLQGSGAAGQMGMSWTYFAWNANTNTGGILGADWQTINQSTLAWLKPDMAPIYSTNTYAAILNSPTTHFVDFTVTLSQANLGNSTLFYKTANGTAIAGKNYLATAGVLNFNNGVMQQTVRVAVIGGNSTSAENFYLDISGDQYVTPQVIQGVIEPNPPAAPVVNSTTTASTTGSVIDASAGDETVVGTAGNDTLIAGTGNDILYGAGGNNTFVFNPGMANDTIMDFKPDQDTLQFSTSLLTNYAAAMADSAQVGADTVISLDANESVTLQNVSMGSLTANNFHFA